MCSKHSCFACVFFNTSRPLGSGCFSIQLSYFLFFLVKVHRNILVTYFPPSQKSTFQTQSDRNARNFIYFDAKHGSSRIKLSFLKLKILDIFRQLFFFFSFSVRNDKFYSSISPVCKTLHVAASPRCIAVEKQTPNSHRFACCDDFQQPRWHGDSRHQTQALDSLLWRKRNGGRALEMHYIPRFMGNFGATSWVWWRCTLYWAIFCP